MTYKYGTNGISRSRWIEGDERNTLEYQCGECGRWVRQLQQAASGHGFTVVACPSCIEKGTPKLVHEGKEALGH